MFANFKQRCAVGMMVTGMSIIGLPFVPFVPAATVLGCWKMDDKKRHPLALGELLPSYLVTALIGIGCYAGMYMYITR